jgi:tetratricopeptide (TPR) repeat protein
MPNTTSQGRLTRFGRGPQGATEGRAPTRNIGFAEQIDELRSIEGWVLCQRGIRLLHAGAAQEVLEDFNRTAGRSMEHLRHLTGPEDPPFSRGSVAAAIDCLARAGEVAERNLAARVLVADHRVRAGQPDAALSISTRLPDDPRSKAIALWVRGRALDALGRKARAAASYRRALRHMPAFREARAALAELLWQFGRPAEAGEHDLAALWSPPLSLIPPLPDNMAPLGVLGAMPFEQLYRDALLFADPGISLAEESVNGYNIAYCAGAYYGVHQSLGPVSFLDLIPRPPRPRWRRLLAEGVVLSLRSSVGLAFWRVVRRFLPEGTRTRLRQTRRDAMPIFIGESVVNVKQQIAAHLLIRQAPPVREKA